MKTMAEVLAEHQWYDATSDNEDPATGCIGCPEWFGSEDALDDGTFAAHQTEALEIAGYGSIRKAQAEVLRAVVDDFSVNLTVMSGPRIRAWITLRAEALDAAQ